MLKKSVLLLLLVLLLWGCFKKENKVVQHFKQKHFTTFEISYMSGWIGQFSFLVDSDKIYISPASSGEIRYGILPDSIFNIIDSTFLMIMKDSSLRSNLIENCIDCSETAIKIVSKNDTIRIHQKGQNSAALGPLINTIELFLDSGRHRSINNYPQYLETSELLDLTWRPIQRFLEMEE